MVSPWSVAPSLDRLAVERAHDSFVGDPVGVPSRESLLAEPLTEASVRRLVAESWKRSLDRRLDPDTILPGLDLSDDDLRAYRDLHPLSLVLPTLHRLLIQHTFETGLIVAVGDQSGRLLWIDGDRNLRRKAEKMLFVEGADWSEAAVGTSAPGTALALDHGIQIQRAEHFNRVVHPWSCTAVPVHDPGSDSVLGVIDITGDDNAVSPATMPLLEAAVAAMEAELRIRRLDDFRPAAGMAPAHRRTIVDGPPWLSVLGREGGRLELRGRTVDLTMRHSEILTLLAWHREGLSAENLADLLYEQDGSVATLRAEMVRLRHTLDGVDPALVPESRPYRLMRPLELDAHQVLSFLERGAHRAALAAYSGQLLPRSQAPGVLAIRAEVREALRNALLDGAAVDTLLAYARTDDAAYDIEVWRACLTLLPARSPKRAAVVSRIERIEQEIGA